MASSSSSKFLEQIKISTNRFFSRLRLVFDFQCLFLKKNYALSCYEIQSFYFKKKKKFKNLDEVLPLDEEKLN